MNLLEPFMLHNDGNANLSLYIICVYYSNRNQNRVTRFCCYCDDVTSL